MGWDLLNPLVQLAVIEEVQRRRPCMIMLSPPCTMYSALQRTNIPRMDPNKLETRWAEAHTLLDFAMDLATAQVRSRRFFTFEHPATASSWSRESVQKVMSLEGVTAARFHQCVFGLRSPSGNQPMKKATVFLSNLPQVHRRFDGQCCKCTEPHLAIQGTQEGWRVSTFAQKYPEPMVEALLDALAEHLATA
jgi:hypothetical protein